MNKRFLIIWALILIMGGSILVSAQTEEPQYTYRWLIQPALQIDHFSRSVKADGEDDINRIKSTFISVNLGFEIQKNFILGVTVGYSFNNFNAITFRQLPISLELDVGDIGAFVAGVDLFKGLFHLKNMEIDLFGKASYMFGSKPVWNIPGLSVSGQAQGQPSWLSVEAGPMFTYTGFGYFLPFIKIGYSKIWANFKMDETIENLTGSEEKKLTGLSDFLINLGFNYDVSRAFTIRAEGSLMPHTDFKDIDFGLAFKFIYFLN
ncbi:MAG: hypothetical protein MUP70_04505 [Candidatus Aminicenantes bacterium]|nr:hypothetical protein [Candidatus Aminicenantes bacterium]